jgi:cytochrome c oxidase subunit II
MSYFLKLWPEQISAYGANLDTLVLAFTVLIVLLSAPVFILLVAFAVKYRRGKPADRKHPVNQRVGLEISWSVIPFVLFLVFYVWSTGMFLRSAFRAGRLAGDRRRRQAVDVEIPTSRRAA